MPSWLTPAGTGGNRAPYGANYYDYSNPASYNSSNQGSYSAYQNSYYPNSAAYQPFSNYNSSYMGVAGGMGAYSSTWNCGQGGFQVRNNCTSAVELSFEAPAGILPRNNVTRIDPGKTGNVAIEPTNFFGMYPLDVKAKTVESNEPAVTVKRVMVNVSNEFAKNYRDCISIDPAGTISFNNFFGKPSVLKIMNKCYGQGVFMSEDASAISFVTTSVITPTNEDMTKFSQPTPAGTAGVTAGQTGPPGAGGQPQGTGVAGQAGRQGPQGYAGTPGTPAGIGQSYPLNNYQPQYSNPQFGSQFGGIIQSIEFLGSDYKTTPDGSVTQILSFNLIKNVHEYRNSAPDPKFFSNNPFYNAGNLRYFASSGYYAVNARAILYVRFMTPGGMQRSVTFPVTLQDFWPLLEYGEKLSEKFVTYGNYKVDPENCINLNSLDFTRLRYVPATETLRTIEQTPNLFNLSEINGCGSADYLDLPLSTFEEKTGLKMVVSKDAEYYHELAITFNTDNWNGQKTEFTFSQLATVKRAFASKPGGKLIVTIKANVDGDKATQDKWQAAHPGQTPVTQGGKGDLKCKDGSKPGPDGKCKDGSKPTTGTGTGGGTGGGTGPGTLAAATPCTVDGKEIGRTGADAYLAYGFQHVKYKWGTDPNSAVKNTFVQKNECDANTYTAEGTAMRSLDATDDSAVLFCDALQASISLSQKFSDANELAEAVKATGESAPGKKDGVGTCREDNRSPYSIANSFKCKETGNMTLDNLFRYALSQSQYGDFLGQDGKLADLGGEVKPRVKNKADQKKAEDLLKNLNGKNPSADFVQNKSIIDKASELIGLLDFDASSHATPDGTGIDLEISGWAGTGDDALKYYANPDEIGASKLSDNWYLLSIGYYGLLNAALKECITNNNAATECDYTYKFKDTAGKDAETTKKISAKFLNQLLQKGKWKIIAWNDPKLSAETAKAIMKKAKWELGKSVVDQKRKDAGGKAYESFYQFYMENINPQMYFMEDNYSHQFVELLKANASYKGVFGGLGENQISFLQKNDDKEDLKTHPGKYDVTMNYNWAENEKQSEGTDTDVAPPIPIIKALATIFSNYARFDAIGDGKKYAGYADNALLRMPIDGTKISWGTAFNSTAKAGDNQYLLFDFDKSKPTGEQGVQAMPSSNFKTMALDYRKDYASTSTGMIASMDTLNKSFTFSPSDPVLLEVNVKKGSKDKAAGFLFSFESTDNEGKSVSIPKSGITFTMASDTISGRQGQKTNAETSNAGVLCTEITKDYSGNYDSILFSTGNAGSATMKALVFVPVQSPAETTAITNICTKDSGTMQANYIMNGIKSDAVQLSTGTKLTLSKAGGDRGANYKEVHNIRNLVSMIKDSKVCINTSNNYEDGSQAMELYWNAGELMKAG
ncbi:Uncharacterised protein [uncultured archaeon]|nr:Uncharacterised protein [uncultured archaeon]